MHTNWPRHLLRTPQTVIFPVAMFCSWNEWTSSNCAFALIRFGPFPANQQLQASRFWSFVLGRTISDVSCRLSLMFTPTPFAPKLDACFLRMRGIRSLQLTSSIVNLKEKKFLDKTAPVGISPLWSPKLTRCLSRYHKFQATTPNLENKSFQINIPNSG